MVEATDYPLPISAPSIGGVSPLVGLFPEIIDRCALVCYEANRAYCKSIGDESQPSWEYAPAWQQNCYRDGVRHALMPTQLTAERNHSRWMSSKLGDGWRYGPVKDEESKVDPCLLPYNELPDEEKLKDILFLFICRAFTQARS